MEDMAENEIELTFIRCPSCKCLMPSTAKKCGMCNFELSKQEKAADPSESSQESSFAPPVEETQEDTHEKTVLDDTLQPRTRLRQQSEVALEKRIQEPDKEPTLSHDEPAQEYFEDNQNATSGPSLRDTLSEQLASAAPSRQPRVAEEKFDAPPVKESKETSSRENQSDEDEAEAPKKKRRRRRRKKKPVESSEDTHSEVSPDAESSSEPSTQHAKKDESSEPAKAEESKKKHEAKNKSVDEVAEPVRKRSTPRKVDVEDNKGSQVMNSEDQLVGWLVNYSTSSSGVSYEIRSGRRFIGRQSLREDDILIQDSAVSTPHCLFQVDASGVHIQDLMSEQGTYYQSNSSDAFEPIHSSVQLQHGDKIKFGTYELIVCLIPR